jgi:hypothetical protein
MNNRWELPKPYLVMFILSPLWWGVVPVQSWAQELAPGVMIMEGKTAQALSYIAGGVSSDEREMMEELAKGYNVKLAFAEKRGPYLSDVGVVIQDAKGTEVVSLTTNGPLFYIQLLPGTYTIAATFQGDTKRIKELRVPKDKRVSRIFHWDLGERSEVLPQR